jgi:hypothetical protein
MTDNFIQISRPNIVSFYTKYSNNISTIASIEDIFESICKQFDSILSNTQLENNNHYLQSFLQSLDKKYDKLELSFKKNSDTIATTISDNLSKDISQQFYTVFKNIETCVSNLNIDNIISSIDKIITSSSKSTLDDLDKNIKQNIILPVHDNHHKLIEQLHKLVEHNNDSTTIDSKISSISDTWNHKIDNLLLHIKRLDDTVEQTTSSTTIKTVLSELLRDIEKQHISLNTTITLIRDDIRCNTSDISNIKSDNSEIKQKIYSIDKQSTIESTKISNNSTNKGALAEHKILTLLNNHLPPDHGYNVLKTGHLPHSCDFLVTCDKQPDIRIECKDYSTTVPQTEVDKFLLDLQSCNNHGIFISLYSNIANRPLFDFEQLPNGKFAIYLSNNQYNHKIIIRMLRILYKLDSIVSTKNNSNITISPDNIILIQQQINTFNDTITSIHSNLKHTIELVDTLTLTNIQQILFNQLSHLHTPIPTNNTIKTTLTCDLCGLVVKNNTGLTSHRRKCTKIKSIIPKSLDIPLENY